MVLAEEAILAPIPQGVDVVTPGTAEMEPGSRQARVSRGGNEGAGIFGDGAVKVWMLVGVGQFNRGVAVEVVVLFVAEPGGLDAGAVAAGVVVEGVVVQRRVPEGSGAGDVLEEVEW